MKLLTIDIYEAVYHFQLLPQSDSGGGGGGGSISSVSSRYENLKIRSVKLSALLWGGNLKIYPGKSENLPLVSTWFLYALVNLQIYAKSENLRSPAI